MHQPIVLSKEMLAKEANGGVDTVVGSRGRVGGGFMHRMQGMMRGPKSSTIYPLRLLQLCLSQI